MNITAYKTCVIFILCAAMLVVGQQQALAKELTVTKTVYVERSAVIDPRVIKNSGDGGFILAGSVQSRSEPEKKAWAAKVDGNGNEIWRYTAPRRDDRGNKGRSPIYYSAAVARDGSVFLCGEMPFDVKYAGHGSTGLITLLDKRGKKLSEQLIYPLDKPSRSITTLAGCAPFGDGVLVWGATSLSVKNPKHEKEGGATYLREPYNILLSLDSRGNIKWKKLIPFVNKGGLFAGPYSPLLMLPDGGFIFSSEDQASTEIIHANSDGVVVASKVIEGRLILTRGVDAREIVLVSLSSKSFIKVILDSGLNELSRSTTDLGEGGTAVAYSLNDGYLALFGSKVSTGSPRVIWLDANFNATSIRLGEHGEGGRVGSAAPLENGKGFVTVRGGIKPSSIFHRRTEVDLDDARLGAVLDFIHFKP